MKKPRPAGLLLVKSKLRSHDAGQMRDLEAVRERVLSVAGAVAQLSDYLRELAVHILDARFEKRLLGGLDNLRLNVLLRAFYYFLYTRRMNAPVHDEPLKRQTRHFAPHGVEAAQRHRFRRIVDYEVDSGQRLEGPYVASLASDYASFHLVGREVDDAHDYVGGELDAAPLYRGRDDLLRAAVRVALRPLLELLEAEPYVVVGVRFDLCEKLLARLFLRELGYLLELSDKFLFLVREPVELRLHLLVLALQLFFLAADVLKLPVEVLLFLLEAALRALQLSAALLRVAVELLSQPVYLFLALELLSQPVYLFLALGDDVAFDRLRLFRGLLYNPVGLRKGSSEFSFLSFLVICKPSERAYREPGDQAQHNSGKFPFHFPFTSYSVVMVR